MRRRIATALVILAGIGILTGLYAIGGWVPILALFGFRVEPDTCAIQYEADTSELFAKWQGIIQEYENSPTDIGARTTYDRLLSLLDDWREIEPPLEWRQFHDYVSQAIQRDAEAFGIMAGVVGPGDVTIWEAVTQLWDEKDDALRNAFGAAPG